MNSVLVRSAKRGLEVDGKVFADMNDVILHYKKWVYVPYTEPLVRQPYFHGFIDGLAVTQLLDQSPVGTFLLRFSSQPNAYTWLYVQKEGHVLKGLVKKSDRGWYLEGPDKTVYKTVVDFVNTFIARGIFTRPLVVQQ